MSGDMKIDFSRTIEFGVIKGTQESHLSGLLLVHYPYISRAPEVTLKGINSRGKVISRFGLDMPAEDVRRIGESLIRFADQVDRYNEQNREESA